MDESLIQLCLDRIAIAYLHDSDDVRERIGVTLPDAAIAFALRHPALVSVSSVPGLQRRCRGAFTVTEPKSPRHSGASSRVPD